MHSKCWEIRNCTKVTCPAFNSIEKIPCWVTRGTLCVNGAENSYTKKIKTCGECSIFLDYAKQALIAF